MSGSPLRAARALFGEGRLKEAAILCEVAVREGVEPFEALEGLVAGASFRPAKPGDTIILYGIGFGPTDPAILHAFAQFSKLRQALPDAVVVIAAGNHELPRASDTTCILRLFAADFRL